MIGAPSGGSRKVGPTGARPTLRLKTPRVPSNCHDYHLGRFGNDPSLLECSRHGAYDRTHSELSRLDAGARTPAPISPSPIDPRESRTMTCPPPCALRGARPPSSLACMALALQVVPRVLGQALAAAKPSAPLTAGQQKRLKERDELAMQVAQLRSEGKLAEAIRAAEAMLA